MNELYSTLEISPRASDEVIKAAYKALMKIHSPDHGGKETVAKNINAAYEILSNYDKRREYDFSQKKKENIIGGYELLEELAEGGAGLTYKAKHILTGEPVCIKHANGISKDHDKIFIEEAKSIWNLRHPSLPIVRDLIRLEDESMALVTTFIPGLTIDQIIEKVKTIRPIENVAWITERILNALLYIHDHGVLHGDLKPQNVIVQPEYHTATLIDFGLSQIKPNSSTKSKGYTPYFASPEQIAKKKMYPASDLYSLGMLIIYMLTGKLECVKNKQIPSNIPEPFANFISSLIRTDIFARPQRAPWKEFSKVRFESFGKEQSGMIKIEGL